MKWHEGPLGALDTETTGTDVHNDRIITAAVIHAKPGERPQSIQWLIHPGIDIPAEASEVHGWTNERLAKYVQPGQAIRSLNGQARPLPADAALFEISTHCATIIHTETPLVIANAAYDVTLLEAELARNGVDTLASRPDGIRGVVDPMVIEKQYDPYRKVNRQGGCKGGKHACGGCGAPDKKLTSLCLHYGVRHTGAHDAAADALAALRLAPRLAAVWPEIARWKLSTLHQNQVEWRRQQSDSLRAYFDKVGTPHDGICGEWPLHISCARQAVSS